MTCPTIHDLPTPPAGKHGWPWTEAPARLPDEMPDGQPWPVISLVTPTYNQVQFIEETIRSILLQGYPALEYFIIDGGSTDGTQAIIEKYQQWLAGWVSERDRGQSDALCKGFGRASGTVMNWINSDDTLEPRALEAVGKAHASSPLALIAGQVIWFEETTGREQINTQKVLSFENLVRFWTKRSAHQQPGLFFPRHLYEMVGGIDETLRYSMDYDLYCRLLRQTQVSYLQQPLARFRYHSDSKTGTEGDLFYLEGYQVSRRYWGNAISRSDRLNARQFMARHLARTAARRARRGNLAQSMKLYGHALAFEPVAAVVTSVTTSLKVVRKRRVTR